ncbi:alkaline phosphatase [Vibrio ziniensis]|uniref:Alkaline phosphatase n=1 Tax=Vibrio ziniensis TaxID=2711221 RepID=A0A6G7CNQ3_9VIBR|nr:alkaline phosphatase [Vibrio ziniensis]QIH43658.1 alkaline phosphatase [Vibrio ziniensis]
MGIKITKMNVYILGVLLISTVTGCNPSSSNSQETKANTYLPTKNIILFIGDGMGLQHQKAAQWSSVGLDIKLEMMEMAASGFIETQAANGALTDSAAAGTAMATGVKTSDGVIGLDPNFNALTTILEEAQNLGMHTGLVTTTPITNATPATFATHVKRRNQEIEIANQLSESKINVLLGGGEDKFLPTGKTGCYPKKGERDDGSDLIDKFMANGYTYVCTQVSFSIIDSYSSVPLIGLFADEEMIRPYSPSLEAMTQTAINTLSHNDKGFFLMVEAGQIDWASHRNDAENAISDTIGLNEAVKVAQRFANNSKDTLIIVVADHETGGMSLSTTPTGAANEDGPFFMPNGDSFYVNWSTNSHTSVNVPISAQGPNSDRFSGVHDNTFIYTVMSGALSSFRNR